VSDLRTAVREATARLAAAGIASPEVDAVELAAHARGTDTGEVRRAMVLGAPEPDGYAELVGERVGRVPLQHLTGQAHFRRLTLAVGPGVFVPRPETEVTAGHAIDAASAMGPDVVVVDHRLSDSGSGFDAVKLLRSHRATKTTPVLMVTGDLDAKVQEVAEQVGVRLMHKPLSVSALNRALHALSRRVDLERTPQKATSRVQRSVEQMDS